MNRRWSPIRNLTYTALACALIAVCSWITVPMTIPFTLQTFAVFFISGALGWKRGLGAVAAYLTLGACGVPVFSGFTGGFDRLVGPTGGYLVGFLFTALAVGLIAQRTKRKPLFLVLGMALGFLLYSAFGSVWFYFLRMQGSGWAGVWTTLTLCVFPFLPFDALKIALACVLIRRLERFLP